MPKNNILSRSFPFWITILSFITILSGCVIVINQPSAEEKELLAIQDTVGKQMSDIGQKVSSGTSSPVEIQDYIAQAENTVNQAIQRINELNIPEKTKKFADDTIKYLESAKQIFEQIKSMLADMDKLKKQGQELSQQASTAIQNQIKNIQINISGYKTQIDQISGQLNQARQQILDLYKQSK